MTLELALAWVLLLFFLMHLTLVFLIWKMTAAQKALGLAMSQTLMQNSTESTSLMSKVVALLSSKDPMTYQAIQAMETLNLTDEIEVQTPGSNYKPDLFDEDILLERHTNGENLTEAEYAWLNRRLSGISDD